MLISDQLFLLLLPNTDLLEVEVKVIWTNKFASTQPSKETAYSNFK